MIRYKLVTDQRTDEIHRTPNRVRIQQRRANQNISKIVAYMETTEDCSHELAQLDWRSTCGRVDEENRRLKSL